MSFINNLYTVLSAEDEREVSRAIVVLNEKFGESSTLRFIEMIFKLGSVRILELLRAADTSATHGESSFGRKFMKYLLDRDRAMLMRS